MSSMQSLDSLLSVLGQTIIIVSMGMMAKKFDILPQDTSALSIIVGKFALPAIFFLFSASLDIANYNWAPITTIIITRLIMIVLCGFLAWIARMNPFYSSWGIMGLFVTQSNDVALGIPVIEAIWDNDTTHFGDYAIIFATLSLFTTSICIALILIGETKKSTQEQKEDMRNLSENLHDDEIGKDSPKNYQIDNSGGDDSFYIKQNNCFKVTKALLKNQLLLAVALGATVNVLCKGMGQNSLPLFFMDLLQMIASPFDFLALLLMGMGMAGKMKIKAFFGRAALFPIMLVMMKMVIFPILARGILTALYRASGLPQDEFDEFCDFTFLYGLLPPAITPVVLAQSFNVMPDAVLNGMMISLMLCAPYMFLTSIILGMHSGDEHSLADSVDVLADVMNPLSIIFGTILFISIFCHKPWRQFPMPLIGGLLFCQIMFSLCKLPCDFHDDKSVDSVRYIYAGNCFFRYASHMAFIILSILNALYRTKPRLIWNHIRLWQIIAPIAVILAGSVGLVLPVLSPNDIPDWVANYHTYCWMWYQDQFNSNIGSLTACIIVILFTLSISLYYRVVSIHEVNKLNENVKLHKFIVTRQNSAASVNEAGANQFINSAINDDDDDKNDGNASSVLGASLLGASSGEATCNSIKDDNNDIDKSILKRNNKSFIYSNVPATDFNAFNKEQLGIDFCFRLQSIIVLELARLVISLVFIGYIVDDVDDIPDQSFYELQLIATFLIDSQGFITFLAFATSQPFYSFVKNFFNVITCNAFKKSNPLAEVVGPSKYVFK